MNFDHVTANVSLWPEIKGDGKGGRLRPLTPAAQASLKLAIMLT